MTIDGYIIFSTLNLKEKTKTVMITMFMPPELDKGILDQIKANVYGYVDDNIYI